MDFLEEVKSKHEECNNCNYDCVGCPIAEDEYDKELDSEECK